MTSETLDDLDDVLGLDGQIAIPRRSRKPSDQQKRQVNGLFADRNAAPSGESWWIGLSREELRARAASEVDRMQQSKFGRMKGNIPEAPL